MTRNTKATLATVGVACFLALIFVRPDIVLVVGLVLLLGFILAIAWFIFRDIFYD